jgi:hypothetical protein
MLGIIGKLRENGLHHARTAQTRRSPAMRVQPAMEVAERPDAASSPGSPCSPSLGASPPASISWRWPTHASPSLGMHSPIPTYNGSPPAPRGTFLV